MATSLPSVRIPKNKWVDLYAATGIVVGTQIIVQNIGSGEVDLTESAAMPNAASGRNKLEPRLFFTNKAGNVGGWAYSKVGTILQVEEA